MFANIFSHPHGLLPLMLLLMWRFLVDVVLFAFFTFAASSFRYDISEIVTKTTVKIFPCCIVDGMCLRLYFFYICLQSILS